MMIIKVENLAVDKAAAVIRKYDYPLLFVHGAGGNTRYLRNYLDFFSAAGWDCYAVNLRGHGASAPDPRLAFLTIEDYAADVNAVRTALNIENCVLIGHSMGGLVCQKAAEGAEKITALVLIATTPPQGVKFEFENNFVLVKMILRGIWSNIRGKALQTSYAAASKTVMNNIADRDKQAVFEMLGPESMVAGRQVARGYPIAMDKIRCPKLVIGCKKDNIALERMQEKIAKFINADKYIAYAQFGHMIMLEKGWEKSAEDIRDWLITTAAK